MEITKQLRKNWDLKQELRSMEPVSTEMDVGVKCKSCGNTDFKVSCSVGEDHFYGRGHLSCYYIQADCIKCSDKIRTYKQHRPSKQELEFNDDDFKRYILQPCLQAILDEYYDD